MVCYKYLMIDLLLRKLFDWLFFRIVVRETVKGFCWLTVEEMISLGLLDYDYCDHSEGIEYYKYKGIGDLFYVDYHLVHGVLDYGDRCNNGFKIAHRYCDGEIIVYYLILDKYENSRISEYMGSFWEYSKKIYNFE